MKHLSRYSHVILFAVVLVMAWLYGRSQRSQGELTQRLKARETVIAALAKRQARVDTVAGKAAVVYLDAKVNYKAIRDSLLKEMAGTFNNDTTNSNNLPPIIRACDAALTAADSALSACAVRVAVRDTIIWQKDSLIRDLKKRRSSRFGCAGPFTVTTKGFDLGASCGIKF